MCNGNIKIRVNQKLTEEERIPSFSLNIISVIGDSRTIGTLIVDLTHLVYTDIYVIDTESTLTDEDEAFSKRNTKLSSSPTNVRYQVVDFLSPLFLAYPVCEKIDT